MTLITHYALAALTGYFAWRLGAASRQRPDLAPRLWAAAFAAVSLCAFAGGTQEGFAARLDATVVQSLWRATLCLVGAASLLFLSSIIHAYTAGRVRVALLTLAAAKFALLAVWIADHDDLRYVVYDTVATILPVLALSAWGGWSKRVAAAPWVLAGILVSLVAALMQQGRVTLHPQFDHSNLFRAIQMIAMYFLFRAGLEMRDQPGEAAAPIGTPARGEP
jgi:Family of unknown function (DUF6962)